MILEFEKGKEEDLDLLFRLNKDLIDRYEDIAAIDYPRVLNWVRENLRENLPHITTVTADGQRAAFFCLCPEEDKWELDSLFVLDSFQNRGIGSAVLDRCIRESDGKLRLFVFRGNTGALRLYCRKGFRISREVGKTRYILEYANG